MPSLDLLFRVVGSSLPTDHRYMLYAAISRVLGSQIHGVAGIAICPISGVHVGEGQLQMTPRSRMCIRCPFEMIPTIVKLAGQSIDVGGSPIRFGAPEIRPLRPAASLHAALVTIKGFTDAAAFLAAAQRQILDPPQPDSNSSPQRVGLGVSQEAQVAIPLRTTGPHAGEPMRRVLRIKDKKVVGFAVRVSGLTAEESLVLQERGIGGRRRMGCGVFVPVQKAPS